MKITNKKNNIMLFIAAVASLATQGCKRDGLFCIRGTGAMTTETRTVSNFSAVEINTDATVYLIEDTAYSLTIEGQQNVISNLNTLISGGKLILRNHKCVRGNSHLVIRIQAPLFADVNVLGSGNVTLTKKENQKSSTATLKISGSGDLHVNGIISANNLYTSVTGSGNLSAEMDATWSSCTITGSGKITLSGKSNSQEIEITGSGKLYGYELKTDDTWVRISGSGKAEVAADKNLDVDISGSGSVCYKGWPKINSRISGSGSINQHN